jgi:hypothetical protein
VEASIEGGREWPQKLELLGSFREANRVLKPGRIFSMILTTRTREHFHVYVRVAQAAGFELANVRQIKEEWRVPVETESLGGSKRDRSLVTTFFVYFLKPLAAKHRTPLSADDSALTTVFADAEAGQPVLYERLAKILLDELSPEDLADLVPEGARGSAIEQVIEALALEDPRTLLEQSLGRAGLRRVARTLGLLDDAAAETSPLDALLRYCGLAVPRLASKVGLGPTIRELKSCLGAVQRAAQKPVIRGNFLTASTTVEKYLQLAVWGWAQIVFVGERDDVLKQILARPDKSNPNLRRLTFGDVVALFRELPDVIAQSPRVSMIEQKFDRRHIYRPKRPIAWLGSWRREIGLSTMSTATGVALPSVS